MREPSPYRQNAAPPVDDRWLLQIWTEYTDDDGDSSHYPASAARILGDRMIWFTGAEDNWAAAGVKPIDSDVSAEMLAHTLRALAVPQQTKALEAMVAAAARTEEPLGARSLSREYVRARLHAAGAKPRWIELVRETSETHAIKPDDTDLDALERWCAAERLSPSSAPLEVDLFTLPVERQTASAFQSLLRDRWFPLGTLVVGSKFLRWTGRPGAPRTGSLHDDVRRVVPDGLRLRATDIGVIESARKLLATPLFQRSMRDPPFVRRLIRTVEQARARVVPPEFSGFLLDDELVCFKGDDHNWNAATDTTGEWIDCRAGTLATMLVWLPEAEQIAAIERIVAACADRFHLLKRYPRDVVRRWLAAARSSQRIPLVDASGHTQLDLLPTPEELTALRAWAG
ncbi:MAG: hypothetical protein H0V17_13515 [Deltaproteobacteria bacterium]|nr:hypothetical protein [Deltaproteobacteria bacterium]